MIADFGQRAAISIDGLQEVPIAGAPRRADERLSGSAREVSNDQFRQANGRTPHSACEIRCAVTGVVTRQFRSQTNADGVVSRNPSRPMSSGTVGTCVRYRAHRGNPCVLFTFAPSCTMTWML